MLHHVSLPVRDLVASRTLYDAMLGALGYRCVCESEGFAGYGVEEGKDKLALMEVGDPGPARPRFHLALAAPSPTSVDAFHTAAMQHGAVDNGPPGPRPQYGSHYYAAFVIDLDGHHIEAVHNETLKGAAIFSGESAETMIPGAAS